MNEETVNYILPTLLLLLPLASALLILLGRKLLGNAAMGVSLMSAFVSFGLSLKLLMDYGSWKLAPLQEIKLLPFLFFDLGNGRNFDLSITAILDKQSVGMMFIVTLIGLLVHLFSVAYMKEDDAKARYFGALSMFMFSMTGIVLAGNLGMMFIFWELVGLSSYLLIGHWFTKPSAAEASKKAFLTNRIGDFGFMIGILLLFAANHGDISFEGLRNGLAVSSQGPLGYLAKHQSEMMMIAVLALFMGAVGKSAQVPLHVWLPDAMEGPTPVSALIHAATMVAAGVYMLVRCDFLIAASPEAAMVIAVVGLVTALMAALMATQQNDIKRILAYSTLSQLGYMVMAVGLVGGQSKGVSALVQGHEAMFHLYTHAFFKAMLFLGSGAVIYACHHEQDIWKMGGLRKKMPVTFAAFAIGTLALMGFPYLSGFYSKESILALAHESCGWFFWGAVATATLTAFYMTRMLVVSFLGESRSENAGHAHEVGVLMLVPLIVLMILSVFSGNHFVTDKLMAMAPVNHDHPAIVLYCSIGAMSVGALVGMLLYRGRKQEPLNIQLFANKFYVDEVYQVIIRVFHDGVAWLVSGLEKLIVHNLMTELPRATVRYFGFYSRKLQSGSLQHYTFYVGAGMLVVIYLVVYHK